jgi:hypothetical protein
MLPSQFYEICRHSNQAASCRSFENFRLDLPSSVEHGGKGIAMLIFLVHPSAAIAGSTLLAVDTTVLPVIHHNR